MYIHLVSLDSQENHKDPMRMSFNDIKLATQEFNPANCIGRGGFGAVYKGKLELFNEPSTIVVKKLDKGRGQGEKQYYNELQLLYEYNHENIIGLIGYSNETNEKLIVYEHASKGSLDKHLNNVSLTWRNRLKICIDVATGLNFLHEGTQGKEVVIHRDIKTANILLFDDWEAKIGDFGLSFRSTMNEQTNFAIDHPCGTKDYVDPMYLKSGILTVKSDVYSFGVALFEILSGRHTYMLFKHRKESLLNFIKHKFESNKQNEVVFKATSEEIVPSSLSTFINIVYWCLNDDGDIRPTIGVVLTELKKALEFQDKKNEKNEKKKKKNKNEKEKEEEEEDSKKLVLEISDFWKCFCESVGVFERVFGEVLME
ncbi:probable receptor-like protein kinase At5g38990 [Rutidosis leptorrhynchoides]|uniref:probable receptor-like protein kinase At5g38990 n=1 Tax=Rutidosis leptorrhynchoides TaxID=125765 RepID=UPI003A99BD61